MNSQDSSIHTPLEKYPKWVAMSHELRVRIYGSMINLLIGFMKRDQMEALLNYCKQRDRKLNRVWYFPTENDQVFLADLFQIRGKWTSSQMNHVFEVFGIVFQDRHQIQDFLMGRLHRPTIEEIYLNRKVSYDASKMTCRYEEAFKFPTPNDDQVLVHYGFIDRLATTYKFRAQSNAFEESSLEFCFLDCGEFGVVLSDLLYQGEKSQKVSKGSTAVHVLDVKFV
jgi:hypothetical protein